MRSLRFKAIAVIGFFLIWALAVSGLCFSMVKETGGAVVVALAAMGVLGTAVAIVAVWYLQTRVAQPVAAVATALERMASGDFTFSPPQALTRDDVGRLTVALQNAQSALQALLAEMLGAVQVVYATTVDLADNATQASQGTQEVAASSEQVVRDTHEQARSAEEMAAVVTDLQNNIRQIAAGSQQTAGQVQHAYALLSEMVRSINGVAADAESVVEGSGKAAAAARKGADVVGRTVDGMHRIHQSVGEAAARIEELERVSRQIADITVAISEIADQTNLLALNAAIEAARAGEHGRGFAVVANEVRSLADRAGKSAEEISQLIGRISAQTAQAVQAMKSGMQETETGTRLAEDAGRALGEITTVSQQAAQEVRGISTAAHRLRDGAEQVLQAFQVVAGVTQNNSAATEAMSAGADQVTASVALVADVSKRNALAATDLSATGEQLRSTVEAVTMATEGLSGILGDLQSQMSSLRL